VSVDGDSFYTAAVKRVCSSGTHLEAAKQLLDEAAGDPSGLVRIANIYVNIPASSLFTNIFAMCRLITA